MELRQALTILWRYRSFLILVITLSALVGYGLSRRWPVYYQAQGLLFVNREVEKQLGEHTFYTYEGFYRQQTAERFTDTVVGLLNTDPILAAAGKSLGLATDAGGLKKLGQAVKVRKQAPQLIKLVVSHQEADQAQKLWHALADEGVTRVKALGTDEESRLLLSQVTEEPLVVAVSPRPLLDTLIAAGLGLVGGIFIISLKEYLEAS